MLGEFGSSQKENEAVLSCEELMAQGASAAAVYAHLLCELTSMHKEEAQFAEKRDFWLQVWCSQNLIILVSFVRTQSQINALSSKGNARAIHMCSDVSDFKSFALHVTE